MRSRHLLLLLVVTFVQVKATGASSSQDLPFNPPCEVRRTEIVFPFMSDRRGHYVKAVNAPQNESEETVLPANPEFFHLTLTWRRQILQVALYKSDVTSSNAMFEWSEGNVTYAEKMDDACLFQGYVENQPSSYAALSTCNGVAGFVQTDEELLYVEPAVKEGAQGELRAHFLYTCEPQAEPLFNDTFPAWEPLETSKGRRRRRDVSGQTKHLEILMAVDPQVTRVVGASNLKYYVATLINIVNAVYQHHTLGVDIQVHLVKLVELQSADMKRIVERRDAYRTVQQFCMYAAAEFPYYHSDTKHDIAVLLTREDLGPAGYAPITGLCNPIRSCAAIKDEGFTSGFIIAHEMAHVFGLHHDGHGNRCYGDSYRTSVMAALVESKFNHFWWSDCSKERMQQVINYLTCLDDKPDAMPDLPKVPQRMGADWSLDVQCTLEFGPEFVRCRAFAADPCQMLWCADRRKVGSLCRTKRGPPMEGTPCGTQMQCVSQTCKYIGNEKPVNGAWSAWGAWSSCNSDCGVGVRYRTRKCDDPEPAYGGDQCEGETEQSETCKAPKCERYDDLRELECQVWNDLRIRSGHNDWKPYQTDKRGEECKQTCVSSLTGEVITIDVESGDGTPCTYEDPDNICMAGKCVEVGCDGKQGSGKKYDACGECGGDGSNCKTVTGDYARVPTYEDEYESVVFLPAGARGMEITKTKDSPHFIALKDPTYGYYLLNGDKKQVTSKKFAANGAWFTYTRGRTFESLVARGPLRRNLEVMMFPNKHKHSAAITYQYIINKKDNTKERLRFEWRFYKWSECSVTCGKGTQHIMHKCYDKDSGTEVNEDMCSFLDAPREDKSPCSRTACEAVKYGWVMSNEWSECSATCGDDGVQHQKFQCEEKSSGGGLKLVSEDKCSFLTEPRETRACNRQKCKVEWVPGQWSECSRSCGEGFQSRTVTCGDPKSGTDPSLCDDDSEPPSTQACSNECQLEWNTGPWTQCSKSCGYGLQMREVFCGSPDAIFYDESFCPDERPTTIRNCSNECMLEWGADSWSECSVSCGLGIQKREIFCGDPDSDHDDHLCVGDKPADTQICTADCEEPKKTDCPADRFRICKSATASKCAMSGFRSICCQACEQFAQAAHRSYHLRLPSRRRSRNRNRRERRRRWRALRAG